MPVVRRLLIGLVAVALLLAVAACQQGAANGARSAPDRITLATASETSTVQPFGVVVWGRVPYCNCFAESATAKVASALKDADLTTSLQELSPRDGWLYFAVTFDAHAATREQVDAAMLAGGAEVIEGPP